MKNIALVGCAHIHTPGFIGMLTKRSDLRVSRVWDHHAARGRKRAEELAATFESDLNTIVNDTSIEAAIVCSETDRHEALVLPLAAAKKHLFVEKPLGMGRVDGLKMADAIERAGVLFQTGYFRRGESNLLCLRQLVAGGFFGQITRVRASNCHSGSLGGWFDSKPTDPASDWRWMADIKQAGVGAFGDLGTHVLDILIWIFGDVRSVAATLDKGTGRYEGCDETGEAILQFKSGVIGTLAAAWTDIADPVTFSISGTKAHAAVIEGKLHLRHADKQINAALSEPVAGWPHAFDLFLDAVSGKKDIPLVGAREAAYRSTVMEAIYDAAQSRSWKDVS